MERMGEIIAVNGDFLTVQFCRPADCEKCHGCMGGKAQTELRVKGKGSIGEMATVEMPAQKVLKASALAYVVPLAGLLIGMFAGAALFPQNRDAAGAVGALCGLAVTGVWTVLQEKKRRNDTAWQPTLVRVEPKMEGENEA